MVTAFHRLAVWPHMRVSDDNAGHEEPLVAALYNNLFQVVSPSSCLNESMLYACSQSARLDRQLSCMTQQYEHLASLLLCRHVACDCLCVMTKLRC